MKTFFYNSVPILLMIGLIPLVNSEILTTALFLVIVFISLAIERHKFDAHLFMFGFLVVPFFEYIFVSTKIETFSQNTYLGVMPLWLPVLWGYSFIAIRRVIRVVE